MSSGFRTLWDKPKLFHDWNEEQEERQTHWTELFYDLVCVSAIASITEPLVFEDEELVEIDVALFVDFLLKFLYLWDGRMKLTGFTTRFNESSLLYHFVLFFHIAGVSIIVTSMAKRIDEDFSTFAWGLTVSRGALAVMYVRPLMFIPRAFETARSQVLIHGVSSAISAYVALQHDVIDNDLVCQFLLFMTMVIPYSAFYMSREARIPIHIAHMVDRMNDLMMVILGEAVMSTTLRHRVSSDHYYLVLFIALWLIFSIGLHQFHANPDAEEHALRRSIVLGLLFLFTNMLLGISLLCFVVGLKREVWAVGQGLSSVDEASRHMLPMSISLVLLLILFIRALSYWGKHPSPQDPPDIYCTKMLWWLFLACTLPLPYVLGTFVFGDKPLRQLTSLAVVMFTIVTCETIATHWLGLVGAISLDASSKRQLSHRSDSSGGAGGGGSGGDGSSDGQHKKQHHQHHHHHHHAKDGEEAGESSEGEQHHNIHAHKKRTHHNSGKAHTHHGGGSSSNDSNRQRRDDDDEDDDEDAKQQAISSLLQYKKGGVGEYGGLTN